MKKELIKLLQRTQESKKPEVILDAVRKANRILAMTDASWEEILETKDPKIEFYQMRITEVFSFCEKNAPTVNTKTFVRQLHRSYSKQGFLSPSQMECLMNTFCEAKRPKSRA